MKIFGSNVYRKVYCKYPSDKASKPDEYFWKGKKLPAWLGKILWNL